MRSHGFGELNYLRVQCSHWRERFSKYAELVTKSPHRLERARKFLYMVMKTLERLVKLERQSAQLADGFGCLRNFLKTPLALPRRLEERRHGPCEPIERLRSLACYQFMHFRGSPFDNTSFFSFWIGRRRTSRAEPFVHADGGIFGLNRRWVLGRARPGRKNFAGAPEPSIRGRI